MEATSSMDPAVRATQELNQFFSQLGVACEVMHTEERGKYVVAMDDIPAGTELVEELPMISWPSMDLVSSSLPFCFHCLRLRSHHVVPSSEGAPVGETTEQALSWSNCAKCHSLFCSDDCRQLALRTHRLLCASLSTLRQVSPSTHTPENKTGTGDGGAGGLTREALARCVAWLLTRMATTIERQSLTYDELQSDFLLQSTGARTAADDAKSEQTVSALVSQLFVQTAAPFNRLIAPPDTTVFAHVDKKTWFQEIQGAIAERGVKLLQLAAGGVASTPDECSARDDAHPNGERDNTLGDDWAATIVEAAVRDDTLTTLLGQLSLNAHAVNDYVFLPVEASDATPSSAHTHTRADVASSEVTPTHGAPNSRVPFAWMTKGAAVYTLLSAFNHSCCPNMSVTCVNGTHEICLKTTETVKKGEELCITYIPLRADSTRAERQAQLQHYLFQCRCPRCKSD